MEGVLDVLKTSTVVEREVMHIHKVRAAETEGVILCSLNVICVLLRTGCLRAS